MGSFPSELQEMFVENGPAIAAEFRGRWLEITEDELRSIAQPTLVVSARGSPEAFRRVSSRTVELLPNCETVLVEGGHFVDAAHPDVLAFIDRVLKA